MFREMRRENQSLERAECLRILDARETGVLALLGDDGYPYAVPLNYVRENDCLYFHCALEGHKIDAIANCDRASFCVIDADSVDLDGHTNRFRSVIAFGRACVVEDEAKKIRALTAIGHRFCPETPERTDMETARALNRVSVIEFKIEHLSGKEARALAKERREKNNL